MDEFAVAMYLIYAKLAGKDLPVTLPPQLVPPSTRDLDALTSFVKMDVISNLNAPKRTIARDYSAANIDLSPANSEFSRAQISSPIQSMPTQDQIARKEHLLKSIETKRAKLSDLQKNAEEQSRVARKAEAEFLSTKREVSSIHDDIVQSSMVIEQFKMSIDRAKSSVMQSGGATSSQLKAAAFKLEKDILESLEKARKMIEIQAEKKIEEAKRKYPAHTSSNVQNLISSASNPNSVSSKAAAMLAERMAALGVGAPKDSSQVNYQAEINKINEEKQQKHNLLRDREIRINKILAEIQISLGSNSVEAGGRLTAWCPKIDDQVKFEDGIGILNPEVRNFILNLKDVSMNAKRNGPLPIIPIKKPQLSTVPGEISSKPLLASEETKKYSVLKSELDTDFTKPSFFPPSLSNVKPVLEPTFMKPHDTEVLPKNDTSRKPVEMPIPMPERAPTPVEINGSKNSTPRTSISSIYSAKPRSSYEIKHADMLQKAQEVLKIAQEGSSRRQSSTSPSRTSLSRIDDASDLTPSTTFETKNDFNQGINSRRQSIGFIPTSLNPTPMSPSYHERPTFKSISSSGNSISSEQIKVDSNPEAKYAAPFSHKSIQNETKTEHILTTPSPPTDWPVDEKPEYSNAGTGEATISPNRNTPPESPTKISSPRSIPFTVCTLTILTVGTHSINHTAPSFDWARASNP